MFNVDELESNVVDEMSDEEVALWFGIVKQQEQVKQMKKVLKDYLDVRDAVENPRTLKILPGCKIVENRVKN